MKPCCVARVFQATSSCVKIKERANARARAREAAALKLDIELPARPPVLCAGCPIVVRFTHASKRSRKCAFAVFFGRYRLLHLGQCQTAMLWIPVCVWARHHDGARPRHCRLCGETARFRGRFDIFASGITGVANAVYNQHDITVCVLDNSTTAMTGGQPHPGTGNTLMGPKSAPLSIERVLEALGVECIEFANPHHLDESIDAVTKAVSSRARLRLSSARRA